MEPSEATQDTHVQRAASTFLRDGATGALDFISVAGPLAPWEKPYQEVTTTPAHAISPCFSQRQTPPPSVF